MVEPIRLTVYIPTFGRPEACLRQVAAVASQKMERGGSITVVVAINGDPMYDTAELLAAGADVVIERPVNLGGNANICLGYEFAASSDYLWILGDDDLASPGAVRRILSASQTQPDLIVGSRQLSQPRLLEDVAADELIAIDCAIDFISATVYRSEAILPHVETAFGMIVTSYPHAAGILALVGGDQANRCACLPLADLVDPAESLRVVASMNRGIAGERQGKAFFGGGLLATTRGGQDFDAAGFRGWWSRHWHRASMYRRANGVQSAWVDRMARSSVITLWWWVLSLPPWWKLKERMRPRV